MFEIYPGFEDLELRVEVEWRDDKRTVIARVERWPDSEKAVVVCQFEDDEDNHKRLIFGYNPNPVTLLWNNIVFDVQSREAKANWQWKTRRANKMRALVQRAFKGLNFYALRLFYLPELPAEPRVAIPYIGFSLKRELFWINDGLLHDYQNVTFYVPGVYWSARPREEVTEEQILAEWNNPQSTARFAWQLSSLSKRERQQFILGYDGSLDELQRVMQLILLSSTKLWQQSASWYWTFPFAPEENEINRIYGYGNSRPQRREKEALRTYLSILRTHFAPNSRSDWRHLRHSIPYEFKVLADVKITQPPTAHEQLEAKLALRDWLADKATPAVAASLLASLES